MMRLTALLLACSLTVGETYSGKVTIKGIGEISLPPGEWILEWAVISKNQEGRDCYVFKKSGDRLERLSIQRCAGIYRFPIPVYFDSIGDSLSQGIPTCLLDYENCHDSAEILRPPKSCNNSQSRMTGSFVYTSETEDPWMSHAIVCDCDSWVLVCVHASPFAISPETIEKVYLDSEIQCGSGKRSTE
jgi:hypothetical protein